MPAIFISNSEHVALGQALETSRCGRRRAVYRVTGGMFEVWATLPPPDGRHRLIAVYRDGKTEDGI